VSRLRGGHKDEKKNGGSNQVPAGWPGAARGKGREKWVPREGGYSLCSGKGEKIKLDPCLEKIPKAKSLKRKECIGKSKEACR